MARRGHILLLAFDFLTIILMSSFVLSFFSRGAIQTSDTLGNTYLIVLGYYVGDKEFERWRKRYHSQKRRGEYFVVGWAVLVLVLFVIEEFGGAARGYHVPHQLTYIAAGVTAMYVVTELLKAEGAKRR